MKFRIPFIVAVLALLATPALSQQRLNSSGRCPGNYACQVGEPSTTAFHIETDGADFNIDGTSNTATLTATTTATAVFTGADAATPANTTYTTTGAGVVQVGGSSVTAVNVVTDGGTVTIDGSLAPADTLSFATNGDSINNTTDATFDFTRDDAGIVTITCSDDDATAGCTYDAGGASPIVIGSADVTAVTITTNDTGDGTDLVLPANSVNSSEILTIVDSYYWPARDMISDGTQCAAAGAAAMVTSGYTPLAIACADNDAGTISGDVVMPDSWDGGTVTFEVTVGQTGSSTGAWEMDFEGQCIGSDEAFLAFAGTGEQPAAITLTADDDMLQATTAAVTLNGTTCAGGDILIWQGAIDATASAASIESLAEVVGVKMEYTSNVGD